VAPRRRAAAAADCVPRPHPRPRALARQGHRARSAQGRGHPGGIGAHFSFRLGPDAAGRIRAARGGGQEPLHAHRPGDRAYGRRHPCRAHGAGEEAEQRREGAAAGGAGCAPATGAAPRAGMARAHPVGAPAAPAPLPEGRLDAPRQAARRSGARCAPGGGACIARGAVPARGGSARPPRRAGRGARAVRLASRGAAHVALRPGAEDARPGVGEAAHETLANSAPMSVLGALLYGLGNLFHPRMLWLMLWPMLVALAIWGTAALVMWTRLALWLAELFNQWALGIVRVELGQLSLFLANVALLLLFVPLVYLTALFILGAFGMQKMVDHVAARSFPHLERRRGGSTAGSVWNAIVTFGGMLLLFAVSLPLWLVPVLWPVITLAILTWVNQRLLRYDAVAEHADAAEMARLFREQRGPLLLLGFLLALVAYIPFVGFLGPVVFGLAFIRYLLGALDAIRAPYRPDANKELAAGNVPP